MLPLLLFAVFSATLPACQATPTFQEEYRNGYVPEFSETPYGRQIIAPDTPYVAVAGQSELYFIDTRFSPEAAAHIKAQIEAMSMPKSNEYIYIDEIEATAETRNAETGETTFVFDPPYARVMFAASMNRHNPDLQLPEHEPAGDWEVSYDLPSNSTLEKRYTCNDYGWGFEMPLEYAAIRIVSLQSIQREKDGESDASYYQRMDKLHWS